MEKDPDFDIEVFCEKTIAMEFLLQAICNALPSDQQVKTLSLLTQIKTHIEALPVQTDGTTEGWAKVLHRLTPFEEILAGLPPKMMLH